MESAPDFGSRCKLNEFSKRLSDIMFARIKNSHADNAAILILLFDSYKSCIEEHVIQHRKSKRLYDLKQLPTINNMDKESTKDKISLYFSV